MGYRKLTRYMYAHSEVMTLSDVCSPKCTFLALLQCLTTLPFNWRSVARIIKYTFDMEHAAPYLGQSYVKSSRAVNGKLYLGSLHFKKLSNGMAWFRLLIFWYGQLANRTHNSSLFTLITNTNYAALQPLMIEDCQQWTSKTWNMWGKRSQL